MPRTNTRAAERRVRLGLKRLKLDMARLPTIPGETIRDVLAAESAKPMRGGARDLQHDGLFGDGHLQRDLF
jgi:hypothetical protein